MVKKIIFILLFSLMGSLLAAPISRVIQLQIAPKQTQLFWLHNVSQVTVGLDHEPRHPAASAGWGSFLHKGNWSLILITNQTSKQQSFWLTCSIWQNEALQMDDCSKLVHFGQVKPAVIPRSLQGQQFWISEDQPLLGLQKKLQYWHIGLTKQQLLDLNAAACSDSSSRQ